MTRFEQEEVDKLVIFCFYFCKCLSTLLIFICCFFFFFNPSWPKGESIAVPKRGELRRTPLHQIKIFVGE